MGRAMSWRGLAANMGLAIASTLATLLAIEAYLRWNHAFEIPTEPGCYAYSDDPRLMYDAKPNCDGTNRIGMRDRDVDPDAATDRIVAIGDSITFGPGVPLEWTWPKQLEQRIARRGGDTEVLNFAVNGYSTVQEVETLRTKALRYHPRAVLLQYFMNDEGIYTSLFFAMLEERRKRNEVGYVEAFHALDPRS